MCRVGFGRASATFTGEAVAFAGLAVTFIPVAAAGDSGAAAAAAADGEAGFWSGIVEVYTRESK